MPLAIIFSILTFARFIYSGWVTPLFLYTMRGDGLTGIFSGVHGYFLPGPLRTVSTKMFLDHAYISILTFYSVFHPLCSTKYLGLVLVACSHISIILAIILSLRIFTLDKGRKLFLFLLLLVVFNWSAFYDGVLQGFPPEYLEVFLIVCCYCLFFTGRTALAGICLGMAATLKVLPLIFIFYFLYKKQYKLVIAALATCSILAVFIAWRENLNWVLIRSILDSMGKSSALGQGTGSRDAGLGAFVYFIFHRYLAPVFVTAAHFVSSILLIIFFAAVERLVQGEKNKYLFGLAAVSLGMFQLSPHCSEMYWYILLLPAMIFNIWLLVQKKDKLFIIIFGASYIFMHGFSLLNIIFRAIAIISSNGTAYSGLYSLFNEHGGIFAGVWLLYFSTYGLALRYLLPVKAKDE